jgi:hypothetical protein
MQSFGLHFLVWDLIYSVGINLCRMEVIIKLHSVGMLSL